MNRGSDQFRSIFIFSTKYSQIDQPNLGLSREYITKGNNDTIVQAYHKYMVDVAVIMGADPDRAWTQLNETLQFEIALANVRSSIVCLVNF